MARVTLPSLIGELTLVAELIALDARELLVTLELGDDAALAADVVRARTGGTGGTGPADTRRARAADGVGGVDFELSTGVGCRFGFGGVACAEIVRVRGTVPFALTLGLPSV